MKVIDQALLEKVIIERSRTSHKGDYGRLLFLGGTYPYGGAIIMAALAAVKSGAGLVTVGTDRENIPALHSHLPEAMSFSLQDQQLLKEQLEKAEVVLLGPGLRDDAFGEDLVKQVFAGLRQNQILIVDGGALTILARTSLSFSSSQLILTPHQKEWEKLSGITIEKQKEDATASALTSFLKEQFWWRKVQLLVFGKLANQIITSYRLAVPIRRLGNGRYACWDDCRICRPV